MDLTVLSFPAKRDFSVSPLQVIRAGNFGLINRAILCAIDERRLLVPAYHRRNRLEVVTISNSKPVKVLEVEAVVAQEIPELDALDPMGFFAFSSLISSHHSSSKINFVSPGVKWWSRYGTGDQRLWQKAVAYVGPSEDRQGWGLSFQWSDYVWPAGTMFLFVPA